MSKRRMTMDDESQKRQSSRLQTALVFDSWHYFKADLIRLNHWPIATAEAPLNRQFIFAGGNGSYQASAPVDVPLSTSTNQSATFGSFGLRSTVSGKFRSSQV